MMTQEPASRGMQLQALCDGVRKYAKARDHQRCVAMICEAMGKFPNAPEPHNLLGIVMEQEGDHAGAMKHFRAAYALDPTYLPARQKQNSAENVRSVAASQITTLLKRDLVVYPAKGNDLDSPSVYRVSGKTEENLISENEKAVAIWVLRNNRMFFCGANRIADSRRSMGLGLPLCKSIIAAHGGSISVSDNPPHGTVFTFTLPKGEVVLNE